MKKVIGFLFSSMQMCCIFSCLITVFFFFCPLSCRVHHFGPGHQGHQTDDQDQDENRPRSDQSHGIIVHRHSATLCRDQPGLGPGAGHFRGSRFRLPLRLWRPGCDMGSSEAHQVRGSAAWWRPL